MYIGTLERKYILLRSRVMQAHACLIYYINDAYLAVHMYLSINKKEITMI